LSSSPHRHDVLVVGGGPGGAATGYWLARAGHDVVIVEKKDFPRDKTCGDGLTPRAVHQLADMGLEDGLRRRP
jgi:flavin-dependent dehydrogenase